MKLPGKAQGFCIALQNGLDPFASDSDGEIPFHIAVRSGNLAVAEYYLELADAGRINVNLASTSIERTPLHFATGV
jgi:ankyrin repeat protein